MEFISRIYKYLSRYRKEVAQIVICHLFTAIFTVISIPLIIPFFQVLFEQDLQFNIGQNPSVVDNVKQYFVGLITENEKHVALLYLCAFIVGVFLLKNVFRYLAMYFMTPVRNGIVRDIREKIYRKYLSLPLSFFKDEKRGNLLSIIGNDVLEVEWSILNTLVAVFKSPLIIVGSLAFMVYISPPLSVFVLILLAVTILLVGGLSRALKKKSSLAQSSLSRLMNTVEETLYGIKAIKAYNAEHQVLANFETENQNYKQTIDQVLWRRDLSSPVSEFLGICVVTALLWVGAQQVFAEAMTPAVFFAFVFAFYQVIEPAKSFSTAYYNIQKGLGALDRIDSITSLSNDLEDDKPRAKKCKFESEIHIDNISFQFEGQESRTLSRVNLRIKKGEKIALVGSSGSGKTTLADLLLRFYEPDEGKIFIDGVDISTIETSSLHKLFAVVTQHPVLFHDTISKNISLGEETIDIEKVKIAAKAANAEEFIDRLSHKYDTVIGSEGMKLSGGERQRICLARAIYHNAPILILDEATSNLDTASEQKIRSALDNILANKTAIIIAHRLSTIKDANKIVVLEEGKIVQEGTHIDLINIKGQSVYRRMIELQSA